MELSEFVIALLNLTWLPLSLDSWLMIVPFSIMWICVIFALIRRFMFLSRF